jgi:hypothetical protein
VVRRDFAAGERAAALAALEAYGSDAHEPEVIRVRLAALKLSKGSLAELRRQVSWAKMDFRDVVGPAEYPKAMRISSLLELDEIERKRIYDFDWQQYSEWLGRG